VRSGAIDKKLIVFCSYKVQFVDKTATARDNTLSKQVQFVPFFNGFPFGAVRRIGAGVSGQANWPF